MNDAGADPDGDGAANGLEYRRGTDPHNRDTDGDGVADGDERKEQSGQGTAGGLGALRGVTVIASDETGRTIELATPAFDTTAVNEGAEAFERIRVASYVHGYSGEPGSPRLPVKGLLIEVPEGRQAKLTLLSVEEERLSGYRLYPAPLHEPAGEELLELFTWDEPAYEKGSFCTLQDRGAFDRLSLRRGGQAAAVVLPVCLQRGDAASFCSADLIRVRVDFVAETAGQAALTRTAAAAVASAGWPPPAGAAALKITTAAEGIHRITQEWLTAQGIGPTRSMPSTSPKCACTTWGRSRRSKSAMRTATGGWRRGTSSAFTPRRCRRRTASTPATTSTGLSAAAGRGRSGCRRQRAPRPGGCSRPAMRARTATSATSSTCRLRRGRMGSTAGSSPPPRLPGARAGAMRRRGSRRASQLPCPGRSAAARSRCACTAPMISRTR